MVQDQFLMLAPPQLAKKRNGIGYNPVCLERASCQVRDRNETEIEADVAAINVESVADFVGEGYEVLVGCVQAEVVCKPLLIIRIVPA